MIKKLFGVLDENPEEFFHAVINTQFIINKVLMFTKFMSI